MRHRNSPQQRRKPFHAVPAHRSQAPAKHFADRRQPWTGPGGRARKWQVAMVVVEIGLNGRSVNRYPVELS